MGSFFNLPPFQFVHLANLRTHDAPGVFGGGLFQFSCTPQPFLNPNLRTGPGTESICLGTRFYRPTL
jgi:hypothetical protein